MSVYVVVGVYGGRGGRIVGVGVEIEVELIFDFDFDVDVDLLLPVDVVEHPVSVAVTYCVPHAPSQPLGHGVYTDETAILVGQPQGMVREER